MEPQPRRLTLHDIQQAQQYGGADLEDYDSPDQLPYCDKGQHKLSSLFHAPQHQEHWKKVEKKGIIYDGET